MHTLTFVFFLISFTHYFFFFFIRITWFHFAHLATGYLGYTSGFSLSCMVFFLISVSSGKDADASARCRPLINSGSPPLQVIYKKFNIPCPLNEEHSNVTLDNVHPALNDTDDSCEAKMFTMNSQVQRFYFDFLPVFLPLCVCVCAWRVAHWPLVCFLDSIHHPHSGLCFRLPSWGSPHLHRAPGVSSIFQSGCWRKMYSRSLMESKWLHLIKSWVQFIQISCTPNPDVNVLTSLFPPWVEFLRISHAYPKFIFFALLFFFFFFSQHKNYTTKKILEKPLAFYQVQQVCEHVYHVNISRVRCECVCFYTRPLLLFHQRHQETYADGGEHLHPGHVRHVPADGYFRLPHLLR